MYTLQASKSPNFQSPKLQTSRHPKVRTSWPRPLSDSFLMWTTSSVHVNISHWFFFAPPGPSPVEYDGVLFLFNGPSRFGNQEGISLLHHCHMGLITYNGSPFRAGSIRIPSFLFIGFPPGARITCKYMRKLFSRYLAGTSPGVPGAVACYITAFYFAVRRKLRVKGIDLRVIIVPASKSCR